MTETLEMKPGGGITEKYPTFVYMSVSCIKLFDFTIVTNTTVYCYIIMYLPCTL